MERKSTGTQTRPARSLSLQYQRESEKPDVQVAALSNLSPQELEEMRRKAAGLSGGMFEGVCEFCGKEIKPFPTREEQRLRPPEHLYCCTDYMVR